MLGLTLDELASVTGGCWIQPPEQSTSLQRVTIDSRQTRIDDIFIAIRGERHDGHDHVDEAFGRGASVIIVHRPPALSVLPANSGVLMVTDTRRALGALAATHRRSLTGRVIAITGSAGKTTVKSMLQAILSSRLQGTVAPRSFNNDIGLPLTLLSARADDSYVLLEIGTNRPGEVDILGSISRPDVAVITMIGRAHLAGLGSRETIAAEKASLLRYLEGPRLAVIPSDEPLLEAHLPGEAVIERFGTSASARWRITDHGVDGEGWFVEVDDRRYRLSLPGEHNARNAAAAIAVARWLGVEEVAIDAALATTAPVSGRMSPRVIGPVTVWDDAYNANPESMAAGLTTFAELARNAARRIVVLGAMLELGEASPALHAELGESIRRSHERAPIDRLYLVGDTMTHTLASVRRAGGPATVVLVDALTGDLAADIAANLEGGEHVLLKGSREMRLERLVPAVEARFATHVEVSTSLRGRVAGG